MDRDFTKTCIPNKLFQSQIIKYHKILITMAFILLKHLSFIMCYRLKCIVSVFDLEFFFHAVLFILNLKHEGVSGIYHKSTVPENKYSMSVYKDKYDSSIFKWPQVNHLHSMYILSCLYSQPTHNNVSCV